MKGNLVVYCEDRPNALKILHMLSAKLTLVRGEKVAAGPTLMAAFAALNVQLDSDTHPPGFL